MRPADMHLTPQELESLLFGTTDSTTTIADSAAAQEAQQHLSGCAVCQSVAEKYTNADSLLRGLILGNKGSSNDHFRDESAGNKGTSDRPKRGADCPPEQTWFSLAAGLITEEEAARYVAHAAQCDWCGPLLKESMEDLAQDATAEEQEALGKLPSASPGWQRALAQKMATASGSADVLLVEVETPARNKESKSKEKAGFAWWPKLVWASAGLAVVLVAALVVIRLTREPDVNQLLAQAYTEDRTIELRMPGAAHGPFRGELGPGERPPQKLYAAEAIITRESPNHPDDPKWLQAQARADLLQGRYLDAENELDSALLLKPNDPSLLIDKATALYQRVLQGGSDRPIDYGGAAEDLGKVLKQNPDDVVALFNRAIVYERMHAYRQAIADLKHYLEVEPKGQWAEEARLRLERLEKKVLDGEHARAQDLVESAAFARLAHDSAGVVELDRRIEDYQDRAIKKWLPQAFSAGENGPARREALAALLALGDILYTRHKDKWLNDLLAAAGDSDLFIVGVAALRDAVADSDSGKPWIASDDAEKAARLFGQARNRPGVLRAEVEQVHALQRKQQAMDCLAKSGEVAARLRGLNYPWAQAQLEIDQSACSLMLGRFDSARSLISRAERDTQAGRYPFLQLRSIGIAASVETDAGNLVASWAINEQGLAKFWETDFAPLMRAHQFYDDLVYPAEALQQWNLALALAQESASTISLTDDRITEAAVRQHLAKLAIRTQNFDLAAEQIQKSTDLYATLPTTNDTKDLDAYANIAQAEVDIQEGRLTQAEDKLVAVEPKINDVSNFTISLGFYQIYGNILQRENRAKEAEIALEKAVAIAESNLKRLHNPKDSNIWSQETSPVYRSLVSLELAKADREKGLAAWELYLSAPFRRGTTSGPASEPSFSLPDLHPLMSQLADQTIVSYALVPDGLAVWVFDDRGIQAQFIRRDPSEISLLVHRFASMCADRKSDLSQLRLAGHALYDLFIAPVGGRLTPARTLVIESDERLRDIPFQALLTPNDRYLIESFRIVHSLGILSQSKLRPSSVISNTAQALVVGSSANTAGPGLSLVPVNAVAAADEVARMFASPFLLLGDKATLSNVEARLPEAEVFHFVGHAISDFAREGLLLAASRETGQATIWGSEQIKDGLFTRSKLVVLAACSTGKNYYDRRESHGQFVRTVLAAGVPHVVASRWDVDSEATGTFMDHFYLALLSGKSVSAALQVAATDLQSVSSTQHPYYWAAFAAFGRA